MKSESPNHMTLLSTLITSPWFSLQTNLFNSLDCLIQDLFVNLVKATQTTRMDSEKALALIYCNLWNLVSSPVYVVVHLQDCVLRRESLNSRLWSIKLLVYVKCDHLHKHWSMPNSRPLTRFFKWKWSSLLWSDHHLFRRLLPRLNFQFAYSWLVVFPFVGYFHAKYAPFLECNRKGY